jgi:hypothetical protein
MTAEEIFSSWIFYLLLVLVAIFLIPLFIDLKKELTGGKKRSKHLY